VSASLRSIFEKTSVNESFFRVNKFFTVFKIRNETNALFWEWRLMKAEIKKNALRLLIGILIMLSVSSLYFYVLGFRTSTLNRGVPIPRSVTVMKADYEHQVDRITGEICKKQKKWLCSIE
jgi:hypothetical protein